MSGLNKGLGIDFNPGMQDGLINNRGTLMIHEVAVKCPSCRVEDTYAGMLNDGEQRRGIPFCSKCGNTQWLYRDPVVTIGLVTNIRHQNNLIDAGEASGADLSFSPSNEAGESGVIRRIGTYDKLTATWAEPLSDGQTIVRGAGGMGDNLAISHLEDDEDRLWYEPANSIWCEDVNGVVYTENSDFILGPGKIIKWVGNKPLKNVAYTVKYDAYCEWIAWRPPTERVDRDRNLGQLVFLRKRHVVLINTPAAPEGEKMSLQAQVNF